MSNYRSTPGIILRRHPYREHLKQYVQVVRPDLISYDHYQFAVNGDNGYVDNPRTFTNEQILMEKVTTKSGTYLVNQFRVFAAQIQFRL